MRRAPELRTLSQDHHHGLVHARRLRRAADEGYAKGRRRPAYLRYAVRSPKKYTAHCISFTLGTQLSAGVLEEASALFCPEGCRRTAATAAAGLVSKRTDESCERRYSS
jgi:hypothetical protein